MQTTLTSKGQITIPIKVRKQLHLMPGDILEFDEATPYLKATKVIKPEAWDNFGSAAIDPWPGLDVNEVLEELRGPVELPASTNV